MDPEQIITAVKNRPALWDPTHQYYKSKTFVKTMWDEIAQELGSDSDLIKGRWKNLRDYYRNGLKKIRRSEDGEGRGKESNTCVWPYMEMMSFVKHLVNTRSQQRLAKANIDFIKCEAEETEFENENDSPRYVQYGAFEDPLESAGLAKQYPLPTDKSSRLYSLLQHGKKRPPSQGKHNGETAMLKKRKLCLLEKTYSELEDDDLMFLKSLLPDIKSLPHVRRIQLRLQFQELVCKAVEEAEWMAPVSSVGLVRVNLS